MADQTSDDRTKSCISILDGPLPVAEDQSIQDACPPPAGVRRAMPDHEPGVSSSERAGIHQGHFIRVKTTYEITINGEPFKRHLGVNERGRLHCHVLPYEEYESALDLVKDYIDGYPDHLPPPAVNHDDYQSKKEGS